MALPVTMLLFGYIELVDEVLISSCAMVCRRYFNWHGSRAGLLIAALGALVLPAHYFVEGASHRYEERAIMKVRWFAIDDVVPCCATLRVSLTPSFIVSERSTRSYSYASVCLRF